jgi:hypothetical protein
VIHVFGDSHSREFEQIPGCVIHDMSPMTMHRVGRDHLESVDIRKENVFPGDVLIFVFGEIDMRCHIGKQRDEFNRDLNEVIQTLAGKYIQLIVRNRSFYSNLSIVCSITPPSDRGFNNLEYPFYGSLEDRIQIAKLLNGQLKSMCAQCGIEFLDVYHDHADEKGVLRVELSEDGVHIDRSKPALIQKRLNEILEKPLLSARCLGRMS